jgi:hypothetical protein
MDKDFKHYAKRLADYVRMYIEINNIKSDHPLFIAYRDFMEEWKILSEATPAMPPERLAEILKEIDDKHRRVWGENHTPFLDFIAAELIRVCEVKEVINDKE